MKGTSLIYSSKSLWFCRCQTLRPGLMKGLCKQLDINTSQSIARILFEAMLLLAANQTLCWVWGSTMPIKWWGRAEKHETFLVCETPGLLHDHPVIILGDLGCVSQITPKEPPINPWRKHSAAYVANPFDPCDIPLSLCFVLPIALNQAVSLVSLAAYLVG